MTRSGLILDDRYRLDERIAAGGVGQVWKATDLLLERAVAVKVLRPEYADHPETLERFRKEAKNAGALSDPHVAQVYDYGPSGPDGSPYLVLEFVDGPSLADLLVVDPIDPVRALDVIAQAAEGLTAAHKAGVVHRDVKPGNILISEEGRVKVTDFGIAHAAGQAPVTGPGLVMGTTQYMAPERIAGVPGTAASDLYALGIVLHECLTGVPPHDGTPAEVMAAHLYLPLPPLPAGVPPEVEALVDRLTAKDPAERISDARELAGLAAKLRDALGSGALVPPARTSVPSWPGTAVPSSASQAALASEPAGASSAGQAIAESANAGSTRSMAAPGSPGFPDEWNMPPRMSLASGPAGHARPDRQSPRRRGRTLVVGVAVGAGVVSSAGLVALLVSGAFGSTPTANQVPAGTATAGTATAGVSTPSLAPSHSGPGTSRSSAPAGGAVAPRTVATQGATPASASPQAKRGGKKKSARAPAQPDTSSPGTLAPGGSESGTPETPGGASSGSPAGPPDTTPADSPSPAPSLSPSAAPTSCFLICL